MAGLKRSRASVFAAEKQASRRGRGAGQAVERASPTAIVYQKGAWTLHMLRGQIGTEKFWAGIREYYRRYRDGNASTADFRKVMEEVSGADLGWFFHQWLYRAGSPGGRRWMALQRRHQEDRDRSGADPARRCLPVAARSGRLPEIEMTRKQQRFEIPADQEPAELSLDPNTWMLMDAHFGKK